MIVRTPKQLKSWRMERGITQAAFAQIVGVSTRMVEYWEAGKHLSIKNRLPARATIACSAYDTGNGVQIPTGRSPRIVKKKS